MVVLPMPRKYSARQANKYLSQKLSLKLVEWRGGAKVNTKFLWACFNCGVYAGTNWKSAKILAMNVFWFVEKPVGFGLGPFEPMGKLLL